MINRKARKKTTIWRENICVFLLAFRILLIFEAAFDTEGLRSSLELLDFQIATKLRHLDCICLIISSLKGLLSILSCRIREPGKDLECLCPLLLFLAECLQRV